MIFTALMIPVLFMASGFAVDTVRMMNSKASLHAAADSAALSGIEKLRDLISTSTSEPTTEEEKIAIDTSRNFLSQELSADDLFKQASQEIINNTQISIDKKSSPEDGYSLTVQPHYKMPLSSLSVVLKSFGVNFVNIATKSISFLPIKQGKSQPQYDVVSLSIHMDTSRPGIDDDINLEKEVLQGLANNIMLVFSNSDKQLYAGVTKYSLDLTILTHMQFGVSGILNALPRVFFSELSPILYTNPKASIQRAYYTLTGPEELRGYGIVKSVHLMILRNDIEAWDDFKVHQGRMEEYFTNVKDICDKMTYKVRQKYYPSDQDQDREGEVRLIAIGVRPGYDAKQIGKYCSSFPDDYYEITDYNQISKVMHDIAQKLKVGGGSGSGTISVPSPIRMLE
ncbi:Tad domain-containing protein [Liberibacter crescens]|uniref:Tad domain-containing protein n=1 Tax=Liberibacter crescens TaxID=1273132 RepID=UPI00155E7351|nr:Tad domain-containing protein [Liberibacter crescens]